MVEDSQLKNRLEKLARHGIYCSVIGAGAFFALFNDIYNWVTPPEYDRKKGAWLKPFMPALEPYLDKITVAFGVGFLAYAMYCFYNYLRLSKTGK